MAFPNSQLLIVYVNDHLQRINSIWELLFADAIKCHNFKDISSASNLVLSDVIIGFAANKFNLDKRRVYSRYSKYKFFGLQIDNCLNWKNHVEEMIPKWRMLCC
jgi:hypothetical protein